MRGGYLATEYSRDTSCCVGSLNNSGIPVKECAGLSGLKLQSTNMSWGMRFEDPADGHGLHGSLRDKLQEPLPKVELSSTFRATCLATILAVARYVTL